MTKGILIVGLILVVGILGYFFVTKNANNTSLLNLTPTQSMQPTSELKSELLQGGSSFTDPKGVFTVLYPSDYVLDTSDNQHPRVYKTGATQKGQTEMYDGVLVVFESVELNGKTLSQWVDETIEQQTRDGLSEIIDPKTPTSLNSYSGFAYKLRGLGENQYYVIQKDPNSDFGLVLTYAVNDPGNVGFQEDVNAIFSTIQLQK